MDSVALDCGGAGGSDGDIAELGYIRGRPGVVRDASRRLEAWLWCVGLVGWSLGRFTATVIRQGMGCARNGSAGLMLAQGCKLEALGCKDGSEMQGREPGVLWSELLYCE